MWVRGRRTSTPNREKHLQPLIGRSIQELKRSGWENRWERRRPDMRTRPRGRLWLLLLAFALLVLAVPAVAFAQDAGGTAPAPTIQSEQDDYAPGDLVSLAGSNWQPGESVRIFVD